MKLRWLLSHFLRSSSIASSGRLLAGPRACGMSSRASRQSLVKPSWLLCTARQTDSSCVPSGTLGQKALASLLHFPRRLQLLCAVIFDSDWTMDLHLGASWLSCLRRQACIWPFPKEVFPQNLRVSFRQKPDMRGTARKSALYLVSSFWTAAKHARARIVLACLARQSICHPSGFLSEQEEFFTSACRSWEQSTWSWGLKL
mmetsp:Transcript_112217/g.317890  ORF Transcript_112217/g.317890 Transcript_112217/m.317890 type:complete len:201 (-) Transcript_112217:2060-2662(-)